jgi:hypothetical protein
MYAYASAFFKPRPRLGQKTQTRTKKMHPPAFIHKWLFKDNLK